MNLRTGGSKWRRYEIPKVKKSFYDKLKEIEGGFIFASLQHPLKKNCVKVNVILKKQKKYWIHIEEYVCDKAIEFQKNKPVEKGWKGQGSRTEKE